MKLRPYTTDELDVIDGRIRKTCHPKQADFVFDDSARCSLLTGRGAGKTAAELLKMTRRLTRKSRQNCLYLASTRDSAERLAWTEMKRIVSALRLTGVKFNESKLTCTLPNGSVLHLFGCDGKDDINRLRGITYHELGIDETASIRKDILDELLQEIIGPRMVGAISVLGTPGKVLTGMFFEATAPKMAGEFHRPFKDRHLAEYTQWDKWSSHNWNITDGVAAGIPAMVEIYEAQCKEKVRQGWSDNNPVWLREYMGVWASDNSQNVYAYRPHLDDGQPWNEWSPKLDKNGFAVLPEGFNDWGFGIGVDVGFADAFALEIFAFSYSDPSRTLYHVYEVYRQKQYANSIAKILLGEALDHSKYGGIFGAIGYPDAMVGDFANAGGALLEELSSIYGIVIKAADKPYKYKDNAIELMNSDLFDGRIKVMKGSKLADEMSTLQWVVDQYGKRTENKAQANHACDAAMYIRNALAVLLPSGAAQPVKAAQVSGGLPRQSDDEMIEPPKQEYGDADSMYAGEW